MTEQDQPDAEAQESENDPLDSWEEGSAFGVSDDSASVSFPDERRPWQVRSDRLFEVLSLEEANASSA